MKKILSLILAISLCLSAVILLASCTGKSAYEVAVEGGFTGTEQEWLASLKGETGDKGKDGKKGTDGIDGMDGMPGEDGFNPYEWFIYNNITSKKTLQEWIAELSGKDGKDGHVPVVTVDDGYWVIDGIPTTNTVDGRKYIVTGLELVEDTFDIVLGGGTKPTLEIKYTATSEDGLNSVEKTIAISEENVSPAIDFSKGGEQKVNITYSGYTEEVTVTINALMVLYQDFNTLTDDTTMGQILEETGFKIPVIGPNHTRDDGLMDLDGNPVKLSEAVTWCNPNGEDLTPYLLVGKNNCTNFFTLNIENGKLCMKNVMAKTYFIPDNAVMDADKTKDTYTNAFLVFADDQYMALAGTGAYTVQMDLTFNDQSYKNDSGWQAIFVAVTNDVDYDKDDGGDDDGVPIITGPAFAGPNGNVAAACHFTWSVSSSKGKSIIMPCSGTNGSGIANSNWWNDVKTGPSSKQLFPELFPNYTASTWAKKDDTSIDMTITLRVVVKDKTDADWGYDVYAKKPGDAEFIYVGSYKQDTVSGTGKTDGADEFLNGEAFVGIYSWGAQKRVGGMLIDNVAIWTGTGNMPENTYTGTYQTLNDAYLASLPATPAE